LNPILSIDYSIAISVLEPFSSGLRTAEELQAQAIKNKS
jgi:hypothetical protein